MSASKKLTRLSDSVRAIPLALISNTVVIRGRGARTAWRKTPAFALSGGANRIEEPAELELEAVAVGGQPPAPTRLCWRYAASRPEKYESRKQLRWSMRSPTAFRWCR